MLRRRTALEKGRNAVCMIVKCLGRKESIYTVDIKQVFEF